MKMKKILLTMVALLSMTAMMAQTTGAPKKMTHEEMTTQMTSQLKLTDAQKTKVATLNKEYQDYLMPEPPQKPNGQAGNSGEKAKQKKLEEKKNKEASKKNLKETAANTFDAKQTYENVCTEINRGDFVKARSLAREIKGTDTKKYSFFMQGYVEYHADNRAEAETLFASAESLSPDFWPALFYHGMVLRDMGRTEPALGCFSKCKKIISDYGNKVPYDFALDSFSPAYIYSLCETFSKAGGR